MKWRRCKQPLKARETQIPKRKYSTYDKYSTYNPKIKTCYNGQTYSGCAVGANHLIYQVSLSEALKSLQFFTNQLLMKTSFWNHSLQPSTHSSLAVPNQHTHVRESTKKIQSFIMLRQQSYTFTSSRTSSSAFDIPQKKNLRVMTVNCSSVINKKTNLEVYINYIKPDVICRSEILAQQ